MHHCPICMTLNDVKHEPGNDLPSSGRVGHFWMKLDSVNWFRLMSDCSEWCRICLSDDIEVWRYLGQLVSMGHPDLKSMVRLRDTELKHSTCMFSPKPSKSRFAAGFRVLVISISANPYSRWSHFATLPPRFHAISCNTWYDYVEGLNRRSKTSPVIRNISPGWAH